MGVPWQKYRSGWPLPSPRDFSDPGTETGSPALADGFFTSEPPGKSPEANIFVLILDHAVTTQICYCNTKSTHR